MKEHEKPGRQAGNADRAEHSTAAVIGRSFSFRLGSQVLSAIINVAGMVLLGNYLAAEGYGRYAFYYALVPLIASLSDLGVGVIITKEIARDLRAGPRYFGDALIIKGLAALAMILIVTAAAPVGFDTAHAFLIWLITMTAVMDLTQDVGIWVFRAHDRQDFEALLLMVSQVSWLAGIGLCVVLKAPLVIVLASATVAFLIRTGIGLVLVKRFLYPPVFAPDWRRLKGLIAEGLPFGLAIFAVVMYGRVGVLLLKGLAGDADVAYYNIGYMLSQPLGFVSSAFSVSAFPSLARAARGGTEAVRPALRSAIKYQLLVAFPLSVGLFLLSKRAVPLLLHHGDFQKAGVALMAMSLGLVLTFLNLMSRYVLAALDQQQAYLRAIVAGLLVNVALSASLIPRMGYLGACVGLLAGEVTVRIVCQAVLNRYASTGDVLRAAVRPLVAALGMGVVIFLTRHGNLLLVTALGAITYVALLLLLRAFSREELCILREVYVSFRLPGSGWLARLANRT